MDNNRKFLSTVLGLDALTCLAAGGLMIAAAKPFSSLTELPIALLTAAGVSLLPVACLFWVMSRMGSVPPTLLLVAVVGNVTWVLASIGVLFLTSPSAFGIVFVAAQAAVVAVLAALEASALRAVVGSSYA